MALILSIDTATPVCSVALHRKGGLLACNELHVDRSHSEYLTLSISQVMALAGHGLREIDAVAVSMGPGSYTGLRIGAASAKGLCYALDHKLIAVNTLLAMALGPASMAGEEELLCPMIDARRMEVYYLLSGADLQIREPTAAAVVDGNFLGSYLEEKRVWFFGSGMDKCREVIRHANARFIPGQYPSARHMGVLAWEKYLEEEFEDPAYFEPFYLKDFLVKKPSGEIWR